MQIHEFSLGEMKYLIDLFLPIWQAKILVSIRFMMEQQT